MFLGVGAGQLLLQDGRVCAVKREAFHSPWVPAACCMHRIHTFPRCHRAHGFRLTGEGWEGEGGVRRHRRLALLSLALLSRFTSGRPTAVSHYTPRLHPDSNNTILIPRVIEFKVHLGIPFYPITT